MGKDLTEFFEDLIKIGETSDFGLKKNKRNYQDKGC